MLVMNISANTDPRFLADPHADRAIAAILGPDHSGEPAWARLNQVSRAFGAWSTNGDVTHWSPPADLPPDVVAALREYLVAAQSLPAWADPEKIARAEHLFVNYGVLSVTLLFCSSLPECYVLPDLSAVLDQSGQLEQHAEYRIRSTGAMIFPVMMAGGLTADSGGGIAQVMKVRLIHATIRHLILRASPEAALGANAATHAAIEPLAAYQTTQNMYQRMYGMGWDIPLRGLPCNQHELAYTLLTFNYVFLRSMRALDLALSREDEVAYLHTWNVAGYFLGIHESLMAHTYEDAERLFNEMQREGRARFQERAGVALGTPADPRARLGNALMAAMQSVIPPGPAKSFPVQLTRYLCGHDTACDLGIDGRISTVSRLMFAAMMGLIWLLDRIGRLFSPGFALSRMLTRVVGKRLMGALLMSQTRSLALPTHLLDEAGRLSTSWVTDAKAPLWQQRLEQWLTATLYRKADIT